MNNMLTVCQACLCKDRELFPIRKLQDLLRYVHMTDLKLNYDGSLCWECKCIILKFSRFRKQTELAQRSLKKIKKLQHLKTLSNLCTITLYNFSNTVPCDWDIDITNQVKQEIDDTIENADLDIEEKPVLESDITLEENEINTEEKDNCDYEEKLPLGSDITIEENEINTEEKDNRDYEEKLPLGSDVIEEVNNIDFSYSDEPPLDLQVTEEGNEIKEKFVKNKVKGKRNISNEDLDYDDIKDKFLEVEFTEEEVMKSREGKRNRTNFKKSPYSCVSCVLAFTRKETYDVHMDKKHVKNIGPRVCRICLMRFKDSAALSTHNERHYRSYRCKLCEFETDKLWTANRHARSRHKADSEDRVHCSQCSHVAR